LEQKVFQKNSKFRIIKLLFHTISKKKIQISAKFQKFRIKSEMLYAPSNRASGPVRAGKPSRPRSRSLRCVFVFEGQLFSCRRCHRTRSWCSSFSTALANEPLLPSLRKLSPCRFSTMFGPDELAAHVPRGLGEAEVLPNTYGLHVAADGKVL
jgi:hypothetical protein